MAFRFGVVAAALVLCGLVLAWAGFPPEIVLSIEPRAIAARDGHAFTSPIAAPDYLPAAMIAGDDSATPQRSRLQLYEQGRPIGPAHTIHQEIADTGSGGFSHWQSTIYFSASDNTDPRTNGRSYEARMHIAPPSTLVAAAGALAVMLAGLGLARTMPWRRLLAALPTALLVVSTLVLAGVITWSLFPPQATWRIESKDLKPREGLSFVWTLPQPALYPLAIVRGDDSASSAASRLDLFEDGKRLGPPHTGHALIADVGAGLYSHWGDTVVFATSDRSSPITNGRVYEARGPVTPAPWLFGAAAAIFAAALLIAWRRKLHTEAHGEPRWARVVAHMPAAILVAAALAATLSQFGSFRAQRIVSAATLSPDVPQAVLDHSQRVSRNGVYLLDFPRFYAPFLEIACCTQVDIRRGETPVLFDAAFNPLAEDARPEQIRFRDDNRFVDFDYLYFHFKSAPQWHESLTLRFPVKARIELVVVLWLAAIVLFALRGRIKRLALRPSLPSALTGLAAASAALAVSLLAINITGLFVPLRYTEVDHPSPRTLRGSHGPGDATMTWAAARAQLAPVPSESRAAYAHRLTNIVAQSVMHYWYQRDRRQFRLQIPVWENYLLWLAGEVSPAYQLYVFADPMKAIERGTGMCDQVSTALVTLLRQSDLDARVVQLNGHTVVTAEVDPGVWHVLDADFNVVIPSSIAQIQTDPDMVRPYYKAAFARINPIKDKYSTDLIASYYAPPVYVGEAGDNSSLGESRVRFEALTYWFKWRLPLALLALAGLIFIGLKIAARRYARPASLNAPT